MKFPGIKLMLVKIAHKIQKKKKCVTARLHEKTKSFKMKEIL